MSTSLEDWFDKQPVLLEGRWLDRPPINFSKVDSSKLVFGSVLVSREEQYESERLAPIFSLILEDSLESHIKHLEIFTPQFLEHYRSMFLILGFFRGKYYRIIDVDSNIDPIYLKQSLQNTFGEDISYCEIISGELPCLQTPPQHQEFIRRWIILATPFTTTQEMFQKTKLLTNTESHLRCVDKEFRKIRNLPCSLSIDTEYEKCSIEHRCYVIRAEFKLFMEVPKIKEIVGTPSSDFLDFISSIKQYWQTSSQQLKQFYLKKILDQASITQKISSEASIVNYLSNFAPINPSTLTMKTIRIHNTIVTCVFDASPKKTASLGLSIGDRIGCTLPSPWNLTKPVIFEIWDNFILLYRYSNYTYDFFLVERSLIENVQREVVPLEELLTSPLTIERYLGIRLTKQLVATKEQGFA